MEESTKQDDLSSIFIIISFHRWKTVFLKDKHTFYVTTNNKEWYLEGYFSSGTVLIWNPQLPAGKKSSFHRYFYDKIDGLLLIKTKKHLLLTLVTLYRLDIQSYRFLMLTFLFATSYKLCQLTNCSCTTVLSYNYNQYCFQNFEA